MISMMRSGRSCLARGGEKRGRSVARGAATPQTRRCTHDRGSAKERDQEGEHRTNTRSLSARVSVGGELGPTSRAVAGVPRSHVPGPSARTRSGHTVRVSRHRTPHRHATRPPGSPAFALCALQGG